MRSASRDSFSWLVRRCLRGRFLDRSDTCRRRGAHARRAVMTRSVQGVARPSFRGSGIRQTSVLFPTWATAQGGFSLGGTSVALRRLHRSSARAATLSDPRSGSGSPPRPGPPPGAEAEGGGPVLGASGGPSSGLFSGSGLCRVRFLRPSGRFSAPLARSSSGPLPGPVLAPAPRRGLLSPLCGSLSLPSLRLGSAFCFLSWIPVFHFYTSDFPSSLSLLALISLIFFQFFSVSLSSCRVAAPTEAGFAAGSCFREPSVPALGDSPRRFLARDPLAEPALLPRQRKGPLARASLVRLSVPLALSGRRHLAALAALSSIVRCRHVDCSGFGRV